MPVQTVTLKMPDSVYQRAQHAAQILHRSTEEMLVDILAATLPLLDDVPVEMTNELAAMALLSDKVLESIAAVTMPVEHQQQLSNLLDTQGRGEIDETSQRQLAALMAEYGRTMLRRAHAVALLIGRGHPLPPLEPFPPLS